MINDIEYILIHLLAICLLFVKWLLSFYWIACYFVNNFLYILDTSNRQAILIFLIHFDEQKF